MGVGFLVELVVVLDEDGGRELELDVVVVDEENEVIWGCRVIIFFFVIEEFIKDVK